MPHQKSIYRVFDWDDEIEEVFEDRFEALRRFNQLVKEEPQGKWRVYRDTEKPHRSGRFTEECIASI